MLPGVLEYAKRKRAEGFTCEIAWTNPAVADLFPHEKYGIRRVLGPIPVNRTKLSIHDMVWDGVGRTPLHQHPTAQFMSYLGFHELSHRVHRPEIVFPESLDAKTYDVLVAPYILAEAERFWELPKWQTVIDYLVAQGLSVGVLRGSTIPPLEDLRKINRQNQAHFAVNAARMTRSLTGCEYIVDRKLTEVAYLMKRARLVLTVDSGPSRLAHAVNIGRKHVLLCSNHVSRDWGIYPECTSWYGSMNDLQLGDVVPLVDSVLRVAA